MIIPKISILVTVHNEGDELVTLLRRLKDTTYEIVVVDDFSTNAKTKAILDWAKSFSTIYQHKLSGDFGTHKNVASSYCQGQYILQLDADELPTDELLFGLPQLLELNPEVELFWLPRINIVRGLTEQYARSQGWTISSVDNLPIVNYGTDYQGRFYKKDMRIKWIGKVHERIHGANVVATISYGTDFALIHDKTFEKQKSQNILYELMMQSGVQEYAQLPI